MELENKIINFKASVICDNVEDDLISVLPKGLKILIECSKIRSIWIISNYVNRRRDKLHAK